MTIYSNRDKNMLTTLTLTYRNIINTKLKLEKRLENVDRYSSKDQKTLNSYLSDVQSLAIKAHKRMAKCLTRFEVYNRYLSNLQDFPADISACLISEINIEIADTVGKLWQYAGLNADMIEGKLESEDEDGNRIVVDTGKMIPGNRVTPGYKQPFNGKLRTTLMVRLSTVFIRNESDFALKCYYPERDALLRSTELSHRGVPWCDETSTQIENEARRRMMREFMKELYIEWRVIEGLSLKALPQDEYVGHRLDV